MITYEIDAQGHELDNLLDDFRDTLRRINNFNAEDRRLRLRRCAELAQNIKTVRAAYLLELKAMDDEDLQRKYHDALLEKNATFKDLMSELDMKKNEIDREQLQAGRALCVGVDRPAEAEDLDDANVDLLSTQQVVSQGDRVQDKTQEAVDRMKRLAAEAEEIGVATAVKMDEQLTQMGHISEGLNDVEYNVKRAQKTAQTMARNAASDRCIQALCVSIVVCIIVIIILSATRKMACRRDVFRKRHGVG